MPGVVHSPKPTQTQPSDSATSSDLDSSSSNKFTTVSCIKCDEVDTNQMIQCDRCSSWTHFPCTGFENIFIVSSSLFDRLIYKCLICCPSRKSSPSASTTASSVMISSSSQTMPSNLINSTVCSPEGETESNSNNLVSSSIVPSSNVQILPASDPSPQTTSTASSLSSVNNNESTKYKPKHISHPLKLQPTSTALVLSDSQLRRVSKYGLDGSGSTQLYSLSGGKISDLTNALNALYNSSLSSRRDKITDVIIFIGGNDLSSGTPLPSVEDDLNKLIGCLNLVLPKAEQHFLPFLPRPDTQPDLVSAANSIMKATCGPHFLELPLLTATSKFFRNDDVHLNLTGISVICDAISQTLHVTGSRNTKLLTPTHQKPASLPVCPSVIPTSSQHFTAPLLPPPPLLPIEKTIPQNSISTSTSPSYATVASKPAKKSPSSPVFSPQFISAPQSNLYSAYPPSALLPTPTVHQFIPTNQPMPHYSNFPRSMSHQSNPLTTNTSVHPPGLQTHLLNYLFQTVQYQILSGIQTHLPLLISQILSKN